MNRVSRIVFFLLIAGTAAVVVKGALRPPEAPLRVAFQVCNSLEENRDRFEPLRAYLQKKLGRPVAAIHLDTFDFVERAQRREFDVGQANGYIYVNIKEKVGATVLAREVKSDTGKDTGGLIVVRAGSAVRTIADLKGRSMVFGPVLSPGGYLTQYDTMLRHDARHHAVLGHRLRCADARLCLPVAVAPHARDRQHRKHRTQPH